MSELRSSETETALPRDHYSTRDNLEQKLQSFLGTLDPQVRNVLISLANADLQTRTQVLNDCDERTRNVLQSLLALMK